MSNEKTIIGLTGFARTGKDTAAYYMEGRYGFARHAFAYSLKRACREIFGLTEEQVNGELKEVLDEYWNRSPRNILQQVGTDCLRERFGGDIWIKSLHKRIEATPIQTKVIVTDVRFDNEADYIHSQGGEVWRVVRDDAAPVEQHKSEIPVSDHLVDRIILNNGSKEDMYLNLRLAYADMKPVESQDSTFDDTYGAFNEAIDKELLA